MAMIPRDHMSTLGPYSFLETTSGAIQYGVPTIVVLFAMFGSAIRAQKPKSAVRISLHVSQMGERLTQFDFTAH